MDRKMFSNRLMDKMAAKAAIFIGALAPMAAVAAYDVKPSEIVPEWTGAEPGVWTMDYVAATNSAAADGRWTLMQYSGMWWCPHCQALEKGVLTTPAWSNYVDSVGTYLIVMDYPYRDGYSNFCWLWDEWYRQTKCGGMTAVEGTNTVYRRYAVQDAFSTPGAQQQTVKLYDASGAVTNTIVYGRVGYPTLLALRPGGSVAGRFSVSKAYATLDYVTNRLEQVLQADAWDEPDNFWQTASELPIPECEDEVVEHGTHTLSLVDTADWYRISITNQAGAQWNFTCARAEGRAAVPLKVELFADPTGEPVASDTLTPGADETFSLVVADCGTYWLKVSGTKTPSSVVGYAFSYSYAVAPATVSFEKDAVSVRSSQSAVSLAVNIAGAERDAEVVIDWKTVDLTATNGVDYLTSGGTLTWAVGEVKRRKTITIPLIRSDVWKGDRAFSVKLYPRRHCVIPKEVDDCRVTIVESVARKPGKLSFDRAEVAERLVVRENEPISLSVYRTDGCDGSVTGTVSLVVGNDTEVVTNLVWLNGSSEVQFVSYAPPREPGVREDTAATLRLLASGGAGTGTSSARLLLRDELVTMTLAEYSKAYADNAITAQGVTWFYGRTDVASKTDVLRSRPLEGGSTALSRKVKGPAVVEVAALAHGDAAMTLALDKLTLTNGFPARVAVPSGTHALTVAASGAGAAFVQTDFRIVALSDYALVADFPRSGQSIPSDDGLSLVCQMDSEVPSVEPGVTVVTSVGASAGRLTGLPAAGADALTTAGCAYPRNGEQRTALLAAVIPMVGKTAYWRMDVRFADDFGNVAEVRGPVGKFLPLEAGAPALDLLGSHLPESWKANERRAELTAPDMTVGVETKAGPIALANLSGGVASASVKSGRLPTGVKVCVDGQGLWLTGTPTAAGAFEAEIAVTEKSSGATGRVTTYAGCSYLLTVNVLGLDDVASTYDGYVTESTPAVASTEPGFGTASLTVSAKGAISGKLVHNGKNVSFSAKAWTARTNDTFYLQTQAKVGGVTLPLAVRLELNDGESDCGDAQVFLDGRTYFLYRTGWNTLEGRAQLAPLVGGYVAALMRRDGTTDAPQGTGYLSMRVQQNGIVAYSGVNSLGKAFSGKTTIFRGHDCCSISGWYWGCYICAKPESSGQTGVYGIVVITEADDANHLTARDAVLIRDFSQNASSAYEGVAWTNVLDVVGGTLDASGLPVGDSWRQQEAFAAFADYDGRDGTSGYELVSAPSNLVLRATAATKAAFDDNDWKATAPTYANATGLTTFRFTLTYAASARTRTQQATAKGVYVPNSTVGRPFWAGYYTLREESPYGKVFQTPLSWCFQ